MRLQAEFHSQSHGIGLKVKGTAERRGAGPQWAQGRGSHTSPQALLDQRERSGGGAWESARRAFTSRVAASQPVSLTRRQKQWQHCWKPGPCMWISRHSKKGRIPDHEKLRVISQCWGVLRRVSELLPLSECWLPSWKMKQSVSTLFTRLLEVQPQPWFCFRLEHIQNVSVNVSEGGFHKAVSHTPPEQVKALFLRKMIISESGKCLIIWRNGCLCARQFGNKNKPSWR